MNFLDALNTGKWFRRPIWSEGTRVRFNEAQGRIEADTGQGVVSNDYTVTGNYIDYEVVETTVALTKTKITELLHNVIVSMPRQPNRTALRERIVEEVVLQLGLAND